MAVFLLWDRLYFKYSDFSDYGIKNGFDLAEKAKTIPPVPMVLIVTIKFTKFSIKLIPKPL